MPLERREHGFALIELLIVVAIVLTIAAIAIPNYLRSRIGANEASAVGSLKAITTAQVSYASSYPNIGYADVLSKLSTPAPGNTPSVNAAGYLDSLLACSSQPCERGGYKFSIASTEGSPVSSYRVIAIPAHTGLTGTRGFCADPQGTVTYDASGGSNCSSALQ
jgi:prepilin-type N-terminal cleavage/methylation domain-containing protein